MATHKCITPNCTTAALNVVLNLKTGGVAKCPYCAAHAVDKFVLPPSTGSGPAAPAAVSGTGVSPVSSVPASDARVPNFKPAVPGSAPKP